MSRSPSDRDLTSYYSAAVRALRYLEARRPTGRRFGPDADARWHAFRGDLTTADRIDLMTRDADAQWPEAFGARTTFAERAGAEDEPFWSAWVPLDPVDAETLWRAQLAAPAATDLQRLLHAIAAAWDIRLAPFDPGPVDPADALVVVGPSAIAATLLAFERGGRDYDWAEQVVIVATPPGHRQLAALGGAMLGIGRPVRIVTATEALPRPGRLIASPDADPADRARAEVPA